jgi:hypothetical protein
MASPPDCAAFTVRLNPVLAVCCGWPASVTVTVTETVPTALEAGVPVMEPVEASIVRPDGRPIALKAYGVVPPVAVTVLL